jgi:hypothetical protein
MQSGQVVLGQSTGTSQSPLRLARPAQQTCIPPGLGRGALEGTPTPRFSTASGRLLIDVTLGGQLRLRGSPQGNGITGTNGRVEVINGLPGTAAIVFDTDTGTGTGNIYPIIAATGTSTAQTGQWKCDAGAGVSIANRWWWIDVQGTGSVYFDQVTGGNAGGAQHYARGFKVTGNFSNGAAATNGGATPAGTGFRCTFVTGGAHTYHLEDGNFANDFGDWRLISSANGPTGADDCVFRNVTRASNTNGTSDVHLGGVNGIPALTSGRREVAAIVFNKIQSGSLSAHRDWKLGTADGYLINGSVTSSTMYVTGTNEADATPPSGYMYLFQRMATTLSLTYIPGNLGPSVFYFAGAAGAPVDFSGGFNTTSGHTADQFWDLGGALVTAHTLPASDFSGTSQNMVGRLHMKGWMMPKSADGVAPGTFHNTRAFTEVSNCTWFSLGDNNGGILVGENAPEPSNGLDAHDNLILGVGAGKAVCAVQHSGTADLANAIKGMYNVFRNRVTSFLGYDATLPGYLIQTGATTELDAATGTGDLDDAGITLAGEGASLDTWYLANGGVDQGSRYLNMEAAYAEIAKQGTAAFQSWATVPNFLAYLRTQFQPTATTNPATMTALFSGGSSTSLTDGSSNHYRGGGTAGECLEWVGTWEAGRSRLQPQVGVTVMRFSSPDVVMAESIVAVIGTQQGPWVYIGRFPSPHACVSGVKDYKLRVELASEPHEEAVFNVLVLDSCKRHTLKEAPYARVTVEECEGMPICHVHSE